MERQLGRDQDGDLGSQVVGGRLQSLHGLHIRGGICRDQHGLIGFDAQDVAGENRRGVCHFGSE